MRVITAALIALACSLAGQRVSAGSPEPALRLAQRVTFSDNAFTLCQTLTANRDVVVTRSLSGQVFASVDNALGGQVWSDNYFPHPNPVPPPPPPPPGWQGPDPRFTVMMAGANDGKCIDYPFDYLVADTLIIRSTFEPWLAVDAPGSPDLDRALAEGAAPPLRKGEVLYSSVCTVDLRRRESDCP